MPFRSLIETDPGFSMGGCRLYIYRPPSEGWGKVIVSVCSHFGGGYLIQPWMGGYLIQPWMGGVT